MVLLILNSIDIACIFINNLIYYATICCYSFLNNQVCLKTHKQAYKAHISHKYKLLQLKIFRYIL